MARLIDISPLVSERTAVWPGDVPFSREIALDIGRGDHLGLSSIRGTVHLGAHTDAPIHYRNGAPGIDARDLGLYYGRCEVVAVSLPAGARVLPEHVPAMVRAERVLFRTGSFPDAESWNEHFNSLSPELIHALAAQGVRLVGIDTPSIDPQDDRALRSHQAVADHDLAILEGVVLEHVDPGLYTLIALPLRLEGADASPVRAVLLEGDPAS